LFQNLKFFSGTSICYSCLVEFETKSKREEEDQKQKYSEGSEEQSLEETSFKKQEYIICLICEMENDEGFALFRQDLDLFVGRLRDLLIEVKLKDNSNPESLKDHLSSWYTYCIEYLNRCVDIIKDKLAVLLHIALLNKPVFIKKGTGRAFVEDISRFIKAVSVNSFLNESKQNKGIFSSQVILVEDESPNLRQGIHVGLDSEYNLQLSSKETNLFCKEWSKLLRKSPKDPLKLRNLLELQKSKVTQELNQLKKLIEQARINNYSLYKAYRFLKKKMEIQMCC